MPPRGQHASEWLGCSGRFARGCMLAKSRAQCSQRHGHRTQPPRTRHHGPQRVPVALSQQLVDCKAGAARRLGALLCWVRHRVTVRVPWSPALTSNAPAAAPHTPPRAVGAPHPTEHRHQHASRERERTDGEGIGGSLQKLVGIKLSLHLCLHKVPEIKRGSAVACAVAHGIPGGAGRWQGHGPRGPHMLTASSAALCTPPTPRKSGTPEHPPLTQSSSAPWAPPSLPAWTATRACPRQPSGAAPCWSLQRGVAGGQAALL